MSATVSPRSMSQQSSLFIGPRKFGHEPFDSMTSSPKTSENRLDVRKSRAVSVIPLVLTTPSLTVQQELISNARYSELRRTEQKEDIGPASCHPEHQFWRSVSIDSNLQAIVRNDDVLFPSRTISSMINNPADISRSIQVCLLDKHQSQHTNRGPASTPILQILGIIYSI